MSQDNSTGKIRILIADDHQIFRDGIISLFEAVPDMEICGVASNGLEVLSKAKTETPDVVLLDLSMPEMPGIEVIPALRRVFPRIKILVLTMHTSEFYVAKTTQAGIDGYLPKQNTNREELLKAIRTIFRGEKYFHESLSATTGKMTGNPPEIPDDAARQDISNLTKREKEIIKLVVEGYSNAEIAKKLFVHIRTVETHKSNIILKLGLKNSVEMVKFAIKYNILEMDKL